MGRFASSAVLGLGGVFTSRSMMRLACSRFSSLSVSDMACRIPENIDPLLVSLTGAIVTWWGRIEGILFRDLMFTRRHPATRHIIEKDPFPVSAKPLIRQWAKCRRAIFADNPVKLQRTEDIRQRLSDASEERNMIVHGFWPYGDDDPESITIQRVKPKKKTDILAFDSYIATVEKLNNLNERLIFLYHETLPEMVNYAFSPDGRSKAGKDQEQATHTPRLPSASL
ncbi:hypothetical protein [Inquilinus sp. CAU 1745]|uniref:hypothetical protein n=1 Tax=Inquilinus sp. CAU 1745 TaxID=3140369 RepID=UPI00325B0C76